MSFEKIEKKEINLHQESPFADIAFYGGSIVTVDSKNKIAEAIAIKRNRIVYLGDKKGLDIWVDRNTNMIDLKGRSLLPGFIDAHMHFGGRGLNGSVILDCNSDKVKSISELKRIISEAASKAPAGAWIKATGYDQNKLEEGRHPTMQDLDEAAPNNPVQLTRFCMHMGIYNTKALEIGGINSPEQFAEGEVVVDEKGNLTGLLKEGACTYMWDKVLITEEEYMEAFRNCNQLMISRGVTSVHDAGFYGEETLGLYQKAIDQGDIDVRLYIMLYNTYGKERTVKWLRSFEGTGLHTGFGDLHLKIGPAKILLDGSSSGPSSATREPYSHDPNLKGILLWNQEETDDFIESAHRAGFQVTAHALGDKAVEMIINAIEKAVTKMPREHRHRIEHCGIADSELRERIKSLGIIPIANPAFFNENATIYKKFYGDRVNDMFTLKSFKELEVPVAIGSDCPVVDANPMVGIYSAMMRKDKRSDEVAGREQCIELLDVLKMYTYNGAFASMEEKEKGSLEVGKLADVVILSEDILETPTEQIKDIKVDMTVIDGKVVYRRGDKG